MMKAAQSKRQEVRDEDLFVQKKNITDNIILSMKRRIQFTLIIRRKIEIFNISDERQFNNWL